MAGYTEAAVKAASVYPADGTSVRQGSEEGEAVDYSPSDKIRRCLREFMTELIADRLVMISGRKQASGPQGHP